MPYMRLRKNRWKTTASGRWTQIIQKRAFFIAMFCFGLTPTTGTADNHRPDRNLQPPSVIDTSMDPCRYFTADEPMVNFTISMPLEERSVPMRVPTRYLEDRAQRAEGAVHLAMLLRVEAPTFEPITRPETGRRNREGLPWDWMRFLINDRLPLDHTVGLRLRDRFLPFGDPRRLEQRANPPHPRDFPSEPGPHGLTEVIAPDQLGGENLFVHFDEDGELAGWLLCSVRGVNHTLNEGCRHTTRLSGLDLNVSYLRTELPNWNIIYDNVARFLACATSDAS